MIANSLMWGFGVVFFQYGTVNFLSHPMVIGSNSYWALDPEGKIIIHRD